MRESLGRMCWVPSSSFPALSCSQNHSVYPACHTFRVSGGRSTDSIEEGRYERVRTPLETICESLGDWGICHYGHFAPAECLLHGTRRTGQGGEHDRIDELSVCPLSGLAFLSRTPVLAKSGSHSGHLDRGFCFFYLIIYVLYFYHPNLNSFL